MKAGQTKFFDRIGPELYRENPFRITGLPIDAGTGDIRRRQREFEVKARLGTRTDSGSLLPLEPAPDAASAQEAIQRLRDPVRRLEDELFWFWPSQKTQGQGVRDEALEALREGRIDAAEQIWASPAPGRATAVAAHNMAVLAHARALDGPLDAGRLGLWQRALQSWLVTVNDDAFWDLVAARAREADDPRLGPGSAQELRAALPAALLSVGARLAVRTARGNDRDSARHLAGLLRGSGLGERTAEIALRDAANPDAAQLRSTCQAALERVAADPSRGAEEGVVLLDQADPELAAMEAVLAGDDSLVQGVRDEVSAAAMRCVVQFVNSTNRWMEATQPLERALSVAATETSRAQIQKNLETVRGNLVFGTCWFCKSNPPHEASAYEYKMYGDVQRQYVGYNQLRTTWQKVSIRVPRCETCAARHKSTDTRRWSIGCTGVSVLLVAGVLLLIAGKGAIGIPLAVVSVIAFFVFAGTSGSHGLPRPEFSSLPAFPPIQLQLAAGWKYGEKPPNAG